LTCLNCPELEKNNSYTYVCELFHEITRDNPDPVKILAVEEAYLWLILSKLDSPELKFYEDETSEFKCGFVRLIREEIKLRKNKQERMISQADYEKELILIISARIPYYCELLHIKPDDIADFKKTGKKWWLALAGAGTVVAIGLYGINRIIKNKSDHKNK
jgi:hypothetical protein